MGRQIYPRFLESLRRGNFLEVIHSREQNSSMIGDWQAWHILLNLHNNSFGTHTGTKGIKFHPMIRYTGKIADFCEFSSKSKFGER